MRDNLFGIGYEDYLRMFNLKDSKEEREKFKGYCEAYRRHLPWG